MPRKQPFWWREPAEVARRKKYMEKWAAENPEKKRANYDDWRKANLDYDKLRCLDWQKRNPDKRRANVSKYRVARLNRMPAWANQEAISAVYREAAEKAAATGIPHDVDHIYPLQGKTVSGLHIAENLRVITASANRSKGNRL